MNRNAIISQALDRRGKEIHEKVEEMVGQLGNYPLAPAQLNNLVGAAYSSANPKAVTEFVQRQAGRGGQQFQGWVAPANGKKLDELLVTFSRTGVKEIVESILEESGLKLTEQEKKAQTNELTVELMRRFATTFKIVYQYHRAKAGNGGKR